jgi:glycosyltransferase involved in cell wall biosynthesis
MRKWRVGLLDSHPIQYQAPWFRALAAQCDLHVFFAHRQSPAQQADAGYGVAFEWDLDLLAGYRHTLLANVSRKPNVFSFAGCDTPEIADHIATGAFDAWINSGWYLKSYWQAMLACKRHGIPVFARGDSQLAGSRGRLKLAAKSFIYPPLLRSFDGFLSVGRRHEEYLRHYAVSEDKIHFVPRFVDNEYFRDRALAAVPTRTELRASMGATATDRVALFVGRFVEFKRPLDLLRGIAASAHRARTIAAFAGAGPLEPEIRRAAEQLGVRVALRGFRNQSQLPSTYAASDFLVLPSSAEESWGLVVNEAMACGRPVIASDAVGCAPDLIDATTTGLTYPVGDIEALARAIDRIGELLLHPDLERNLRAKMDVYSCERAVEGTLAAIESVLR